MYYNLSDSFAWFGLEIVTPSLPISWPCTARARGSLRYPHWNHTHEYHAVTCASRGSAVSSRSTPIAVVTTAHTATTGLYESVSGAPFLQLQHLSFPSAVMSSRSTIAEEHLPCRSTMSLSTRFGLLCRRIWTSMRSGYVPRRIFQQPA